MELKSNRRARGTMSAKLTNRYDMRKNVGNQYWTVFDIFTGQPVMANERPVTNLFVEEAYEMVTLLNREYIDRHKGSDLKEQT
jgi:hypothetical protein